MCHGKQRHRKVCSIQYAVYRDTVIHTSIVVHTEYCILNTLIKRAHRRQQCRKHNAKQGENSDAANEHVLFHSVTVMVAVALLDWPELVVAVSVTT